MTTARALPSRQRATSFGEQTPRANVRALPAEPGLPLPPQPASGRASPSLSVSSRVVRHASNPGPPPKPIRAGSGSGSTHSGVGVSPLKSLDSYNARNVAAALESGGEGRNVDDVWQSVCIRVLPLFNGEGHRGFVEDLNELVIQHVQRTFARCQSSSRPRPSNPTPSADVSSLVTGLLIADLSELINIGCLTLSGKLAPSPPAAPLADEHFLLRLNEMWSFFWTGVLPHLESIFWVLRCDERLKAAVGGTGREREREGRTAQAEGRIDVRSLALIGFRDQLIHPQFHRIVYLFHELYESRPPSRVPSRPSSPSHSSAGPPSAPPLSTNNSAQSGSLHPPTASSSGLLGTLASVQAANSRRRQMVAILASLLTGDERQQEIDTLLSHMRAGLAINGGRRTPVFPPEVDTPGLDDHERHTFVKLESAPSTFSAPQRSSGVDQRPRSGTLDSLDEEGTTASSTVEVHEGSATPQLPPPPPPSKTRRRGFLPLLGRTRSGNANDSATIASTAKAVAAPLPVGVGEEDLVMPDLGRVQRSPKTTRWGRGRSSSGRGEESEGTTGSEVEPVRG